MTQPQRSKRAWARWRKLLSQQGQSGQTVAGFCRARRLRAAQFYWWKKRLREAEARAFVEVKMATAALPPGAAGASAGGAGIEVRLKNDLRVLVQPGFDAHHLQALLAVLESRA